MTGAGIVLSDADAVEVARRADVYAEELMVETELGEAVARRVASTSVRMERGAAQSSRLGPVARLALGFPVAKSVSDR